MEHVLNKWQGRINRSEEELASAFRFTNNINTPFFACRVTISVWFQTYFWAILLLIYSNIQIKSVGTIS